VTKTNALESLVIASFVPGLPVRDVEAALAEALGDQAAISKSTVSSVCGQIKDEYAAWARRRLDGITLDYLFLDACFFRMQAQPGPRLVELIDNRITEIAAKYSPMYPAAMKCLLADREGLTAYLRFPAGHHHRIRHSNFIERTFGETRRRTKVIGRLPGETSCLTLVWAVLDRASRGWRGLTMTSDGLRLLQDLRRSLLDPPRQLRPRTVTATQDDDRPGNVSTVA